MAAHVGDSRVYLLHRRRHELARLTQDHTLGAEWTAWGIPAAEMLTEQEAGTLTQAIGATRKVNPRPATARWEPGDVVMICTDGVSDRVDDDEIATVLLLAGDLGDAARRLVRRARELGGWDDATAVLVRRVA